MYVRVSDDENAFKFLQINVPVIDQMGAPVIDPRTGKPALHNEIGRMDMDIIIESAPDTITAAEDQFNMLIKLRELGEPIPATAIIQASSLRNKRQILDAIEQQQQQQQQAQQQQQMMQMQMAAHQQSQQPPPPNPADMAHVQIDGQRLQLEGQKINQAAQRLGLDHVKVNADAASKVAKAHKDMAEARRTETETQVMQALNARTSQFPVAIPFTH